VPSLAGGASSDGGSLDAGTSSSCHQPTSRQEPSFQPIRS